MNSVSEATIIFIHEPDWKGKNRERIGKIEGRKKVLFAADFSYGCLIGVDN